MGTFLFKWDKPAAEVFIAVRESGFLHPEKLHRLRRSDNGVFELNIPLELLKDAVVYYQFVVDGKRTLSPSIPHEKYPSGDYHFFKRGHHQLNPIPTNPGQCEGFSEASTSIPKGKAGSLPENSTPSSLNINMTSLRSPSRAYPYRKLDFDTHEIRLLKLEWTYAEDSSITYSLDHASLIDPGSYVALSYCWGDPLITEIIRLDGVDVRVTVNLASALRAVQKRYFHTGNGIRVWADALCINQGDNEERSHQVRSMRQIYSRASLVFCWIGVSQPSRLSEVVKYWLQGQLTLLSVEDPQSSWMKESWELLNHFFSQPYWKRIWIIQEIAAASKVQVMFGDVQIPWDGLAALLDKMQEVSSQSQVSHRLDYRNALHLPYFRDRFFIRRQPISLIEAIRLTSQALSTDPRDKIYALLGLCHDGHIFVPVPNYKQPPEVVLADMTRSMISMNRSLDIICLKGTGPRNIPRGPDLPSWVPDWINLWSRPLTIQEAEFSNWQSMYDFNPIANGSNNQILKVQARRIGRLARLSTSISPDGKIKNDHTNRSPWIHRTSLLSKENERLRNPSQTELQLRDFIWQTLTMSQVETELARSCFASMWKPEGRGLVHELALIAWLDQNAWFKVKDWTLREWSQMRSKFVIQTEQPGGIILQVKRSVSWEVAPKFDSGHLISLIEVLGRIVGSGMSLATLTGGQPVALVHPDSQEEDEIYLLQGCTIPIVLRRSDSPIGEKQYRVIGGAYTLGTDKNSSYYRGTKDIEDLLDWEAYYRNPKYEDIQANWDNLGIQEITIC